jgi:hypothetical protein
MKLTKAEMLMAGRTIISKEPGNSMLPDIKSRQPVRLAPVKSWEDVSIFDIVYCKIRGRYLTHRVVGKDPHKGCQIANNKGFVNGWTKQVYGKVIEIL